MATESFTDRILNYIQAREYRPRRLREIALALGIGQAEQGDFHAACRALMRTGRIVLGGADELILPSLPRQLTGTFRANPRGFGFVVPDVPNAHGDLYVPPGATMGAMTGDTVKVSVEKRRRGPRGRLFEGRITAILHRGQSRFVGEFQQVGRRWLVIPDGNTLHVPIAVADASARDARPGDQVVVELTQYPEGNREARGAIIKVLGSRGDPGVETRSIIEQYGFRTEFPEGVLEEARRAARSFDTRHGLEGREDFRDRTTITIDPVDARDFDDAISIRRNRDGTVELGVHIADVSHFVRLGGALDQEARERANSVYLPRTVIPMLPEVLSNGVCSLQERQTRLTKSVLITYDENGVVHAARVTDSVIRSTKRLTYEQAQRILDGKPGRTSANVVALMRDAEDLARRIRERRLREGMLVLDLPEVEPVYDDEGHIIDVRPAGREFSHTIIEMFMVEANEAVARTLSEIGVPFLRRIHDARKELADGSLQPFLRALGYHLPRNADRFAVQGLLTEVAGRPEAFAVHLAVLRSLDQAEYSTAPVGHFALASEHYCHFTSPIRRYPDLTIHRLVEAYIRPNGDVETPDDQRLEKLGAHCSANERRAEAAERELVLVLTLRLLEKKMGDELTGVVTGVSNVGLFVQLEKYLIDGLLRFEHLSDDWWRVDPGRGSVVGQRSGTRIKVGDPLEVVVSRIHIPTRQLDLALAHPSSSRGKAKPRPSGRSRVKPVSTESARFSDDFSDDAGNREARPIRWTIRRKKHAGRNRGRERRG
jgi:ribonuclease R